MSEKGRVKHILSVITFFIFQNNPISLSEFTIELLCKNLIMKKGTFS